MIGTVFGGPMWGIISDKWHCHRNVLIVMTMLSIITMCSKPFIGIQYGNADANSCRVGTTVNLPFTNTSSIQMDNDSSTFTTAKLFANNETMTENTSVEKSQRFGTLFFVMFFASTALSYCEGSFIAFVDTVTIRKAQLSLQRKINFGVQRMWSPPGAVAGNIVTNLAIQYFPTGKISCFTPIFIIFPVLSIFLLISLLILYRNVSFKNDLEENLFIKSQQELDEQNNEQIRQSKKDCPLLEEKPKPFRKILRESIIRVDIIVLYSVTFVFGMMHSPLLNFHYLYLKELNAPQFAYSAITAAGALPAILSYIFSQSIVKKIGAWNTITFTAILYVVVLMTFGMANSFWFLIAARPAFGCAFCLSIAASICHLKKTSPVATITTMISIFNTIHLGCGPVVGLVLSGEIYEAYNGSIMYTTFAIIAIVLTCFIAIYSFYYSNLMKKNEKSLSQR